MKKKQGGDGRRTFTQQFGTGVLVNKSMGSRQPVALRSASPRNSDSKIPSTGVARFKHVRGAIQRFKSYQTDWRMEARTMNYVAHAPAKVLRRVPKGKSLDSTYILLVQYVNC